MRVAALLLAMAGCVAPAAHGRAVRLQRGEAWGCGAVVGSSLVVTAAHVVSGNEVWVATLGDHGWVEARVLRSRREPGDLEAVVTLELPTDEGWYGTLFGFEGWPPEDCYAVSGGAPAAAVTPHGTVAWQPGAVVHGDSGSPVVDEHGDLVGVVSGWGFQHEPIFLRVRAAADLARGR